MSKESTLFDYCRWNKTQKATNFLEQNDNLDLTYDEGVCFKLAIKKDNVIILEALLKYYKKHRLSGDGESAEYRQASWELNKILDDADSLYDFSHEVKDILNPYFSFDEEKEQDLGIGEDEEYIISPTKESAFELPDAAVQSVVAATIDRSLEENHTPYDGANAVSSDDEAIPDFCGWPEGFKASCNVSGGNSLVQGGADSLEV